MTSNGASGKAPARPRDELGRPLPWGAPNRLVLEDYDALSVEENHRLGIRHFDERRFFPAHEAWESAWKQSRSGPNEEFFKGLAQLGAGYVHYQRRNGYGARVLLERAVSRLRPYGPIHRGLDIAALVAAIQPALDALAAVRRGDPLPDIDFPTIGR